MTQTMTSRSLLMLAGFGLVLAGAACGDDGGSSNSTPAQAPAKRAASPAAAAAVAAGQAQGLATYTKVDEELRHQLTEIDFLPDASGEINRNPFRSWVLQPPVSAGTGDFKPVDVCTEGKVRWGAPSYSVRDLELIGLVKRGRSYAQFTDGSESDSWIVRKGDCIGQEKAIIEEIGVGYVRLSITPPAPPGAPAPPAQKQDISLHPDELEIPDSVIGDFDDEQE